MAEKIKYSKKSVADLIPYANNAKKHSKAQIDKIVKSFQEFGVINPVIVDKDNGIIAGHARVMAAKKMKLKEIDTLEVSHLTEAQKRAYILADNRLAELAEWDNDLLKLELEELKSEGFDFDLTGFDENILNDSKGSALSEYTSVINTPTYEPSDIRPLLSECYETEKTDDLIQEIKQAAISAEEKAFLMAAAHRHTVIRFDRAADYYSHASEEMRAMMEKQALVIIDYGAAIENGYVKMNTDLLSLRKDL